MPEQQTDVPVVDTPTEVSIDSKEVPFADFVKARREGKTTAIPAESAAPAEAQEQETETPEAATDEGAAKPGSESGTEPSRGKQRSQGGFQRKIDKLTTRNYELQNQLDQLRQQRPSTTQPPAQPPTQQPSKADERPNRAQFNSEEEFFDAKVAWGVRQGIAQERAAEQQRAEQEKAKAVVDGHHQRLSEALGKYDDFEEVLQASKAEVSQAAGVYIQRLDNGPDVMYHLATHPEIAEEIHSMEPIDQVGALGRISAELRKGSEPKPRKGKPESQAPEPISPVAANTKSSPTPLGEAPFMDFMKRRQAGQSR